MGERGQFTRGEGRAWGDERDHGNKRKRIRKNCIEQNLALSPHFINVSQPGV